MTQTRFEQQDDAARRVLIVSADMGGGHDAAAAALAERVQHRWPGSVIRRVDTLDAIGWPLGPLFRGIYVANVQWTPWLYQFFYDSLWRYRWFAVASKAFIAAWSGRRLAGEIEQFDPDMIISTYPLGSGGLDWLRRHRSLAVPIGAWVTDFAPHPFWVYRDVDITFVMHEGSLQWAQRSEPGARVEVAAPPVAAGFGPGSDAGARAMLDLDRSAFVVLVSCGAYGFGDVAEAVRAILAAGSGVSVIVACGRNTKLQQRLQADLGRRYGDRLRLLGWRSDMPDITRAADVVVTNAGGMTGLEALVCQRPVIMYRPIAAHGIANARLMRQVGLASVCHHPAELTTLIVDLAGRAVNPLPPKSSGDRDRQRDDGLAELAAVRLSTPQRSLSEPSNHPLPATDPTAWPLRAEDGFFIHVENATNSQHVGVVIATQPVPGNAALTAAALRAIVGTSIDRLPTLRRRMVRRGSFRRPGWVVDPTVDLRRHITELWIVDDVQVQRSLDRFWSEPLTVDQPPWQAIVIRRANSDEAVIGFKFHHALGDAISLMGTLDRVLGRIDGRPSRTERQRTPSRLSLLLPRAAHTTHGLVSLIRHAGAPKLEINRQPASGARGLLTLAASNAALRTLGGAERFRSSERLLGLLAEAVHRSGLAGDNRAGFARTMLPVAMQLGGSRRTAGNRTGVVAVDLPLGDLSLSDRIRIVRRDLHRRMEIGEPEAGAFVMRLMGKLPAPVHRRLARLVYTDRFFNLLTSYLPGPLERRVLAGNVITGVYPVLALADRVRIAVGIMRYAGTTEICLVFDDAVRPEALGLRNALHMVLQEHGVVAQPGPITHSIHQEAS